MTRFLKIIASGIGFSSLGFFGILFSLFGVPLLYLFPGGKAALQVRTRQAFFWYFKTLVGFLAWAGIFTIRRLSFPPRKALDGTLILATHPGYLDVVILLGSIEQLTCVVKPGIWNNPLFGWAVRAAGYIPALDPTWVIEEGAKALARGEALLLFPEGTRTLPGLPFRFHRGAAHLALRSGAPLVPLIVTCEPPLLAKGHRWYHMPENPCDYQIRALAPMGSPFTGSATLAPTQAARDLTEWLEAEFDKEVYGARHQSPGDQTVHREDAGS